MVRSTVDLVGNRWLLRRVAPPIAALVVVVLVGVVGFSLIGGVGVVEAAFWLLDPSSVEIYFETHPGPARATKAFAIVVRVALVLTLVWTGETALTAAFGGQIREEFERMQEERRRSSLAGHTVICGYGMFGRTVAERLRDDGRDVVVVERDPDEYRRVREDDFLGVEGDARSEEVLQSAGVDRADALVAAIDDSNANIQIAVLAAQLAPEVTVVVRVGDETYESVARHAGADEVVIPEVAGGELVWEHWRADAR